MGRKKRNLEKGQSFVIKNSERDPAAPMCPICGTARLGVRMFDSNYGCVVHADCLGRHPEPAQTCEVCGNAKAKRMVKTKGGAAHVDCLDRKMSNGKKAKTKRYGKPAVGSTPKKKGGRRPRSR